MTIKFYKVAQNLNPIMTTTSPLMASNQIKVTYVPSTSENVPPTPSTGAMSPPFSSRSKASPIEILSALQVIPMAALIGGGYTGYKALSSSGSDIKKTVDKALTTVKSETIRGGAKGAKIGLAIAGLAYLLSMLSSQR